MATVRFVLGLVFLAVIGSSGLSFGNILTAGFVKGGYPVRLRYWSGALSNNAVYKPLIPIAEAELGVREATGNNDGFRVEQYLATVGLKKGNPYCAAFISWVFKQAGYASPRTGWSPALFPTAKLVKFATPGNVFGIYFPSLKRIAHCGFVVFVKDSWIGTIEGNTNVAGSREGEGVYRRVRHKKEIGGYANWR